MRACFTIHDRGKGNFPGPEYAMQSSQLGEYKIKGQSWEANWPMGGFIIGRDIFAKTV